MIRICFENGPELTLLPAKSEGPGSTLEPCSPQYCRKSSFRPTSVVSSGADFKGNRLQRGPEITQILKQFRRKSNSELRLPKLENLRYRIMRSIKKLIRRLLHNQEISKKGLLAVPGGLDSASLSRIKDYCHANRSVLEQFSALQNGPCVDHRHLSIDTGHNTYNNAYMRAIFSQHEVREAYTLYIHLLFTRDQPDSLCRRFKMECCLRQSHDDDCCKKWNSFKASLMDFLGAEVQGGNSQYG
jgi:hypothetical protein